MPELISMKDPSLYRKIVGMIQLSDRSVLLGVKILAELEGVQIVDMSSGKVFLTLTRAEFDRMEPREILNQAGVPINEQAATH